MSSATELEAISQDPRGVLAGKVVAGRYRLEKPIGSGGMATIWAATHLTLGQPVALKLLEVTGPQTKALCDRFLREARLAAAVRHRNVVDIIDFGTSEDGQPFMAMELLEGKTLAQRMKTQETIAVADVVRHMARVLSGLGAVHDAGLVHRDLKPENVFLVEDADGVYPKLLDFGISRSLHSGIESVLPTMENAIVGTPQYMSPEQARGLAGLDHRSDLWSVGVMLFELLTGVLPYDSDAVGDIIIQIVTDEPPDFGFLRPDLRGPLEHVVKKAMSKSPDDRFASAREMRTALLSAVAATAANLHAAQDYDRFALDTQDVPQPADLLDALGSAYEPGDSKLLDFTEQMEAIKSWRPPEPGRIPPAPNMDGDPFAAPIAGPAGTGRAGTRRPVVVAIVALLALGALGAGMGVLVSRRPPRPEPAAVEPIVESSPTASARPGAANAPAPDREPGPPDTPTGAVVPARVTVALESVPRGAEIFVDGQAWDGGSVVELAQDGAVHTIEVRAADGRSWAREHTASAGGSYSVVLPRRRVRTRRPHRPAHERGENRRLLRDPGF